MTSTAPVHRRVAALAAIVVLAAGSMAPAAADTEDEIAEAVQASQEVFDDDAADGAVLTRADEIADARAGSPLADAVGGPMLLTDPDELDEATAAELTRAMASDGTVHLLGGHAAISPEVEQSVTNLGFHTERHGGATRFDTAEEIAHAMAGLREFAIEDVDSRGHPDEVVVQVTRSQALRDTQVPPSAWSVTEDGEEREVKLLDTGVADLEVVLALDVGADMDADSVDAARNATAGFVGQMPSGSQVGVAASGEAGAELLHAPDDDHNAARDTLDAFTPGETGLHDVLDVSLSALAGADVPAVVVLSDGSDLGSDGGIDLDTTLELVQAAGVTVHVVELVTDDGNPDALKQLADAGGGRRVPAGDPAALAPLYDDLAYELVGPQRLAYTSEAGGETDLTVAVDHATVSEQTETTVTLPPAPITFDTGFFTSDAALLVGAGLFYVAMAVSILALLAPRQRSSQLTKSRARVSGVRGDRTIVAGLSDRLVGWADDTLRQQGKRSAINEALDHAGIALRPGELVVLIGCAGVAVFAVGMVLASAWLGLLLAALTVPVAKALISRRARKRQERFIGQLSDTLQLLAGGLRSGYGLQQALDAAAKEADSPTSEELSRVVVEVRLGRDLMDSLRAMADRMDSEDFQWVVQAIDIQREVGGDLAEVIDNVSATVRERARIRRQVRALSAEGRLSAWILFALPFAVGGFIMFLNPGYVTTLTTSIFGYAMLAGGAVLLTLGGLWLRNLVDLEY